MTLAETLDLFGRLVVGTAFLGSGISKVRMGHSDLKDIVTNYRLGGPTASAVIARTLPWAEIGVAALLLGNISLTIGWALAGILLGGFSFAISINLLRGRRDIRCGCFGRSRTLSWTMVSRNLVLIFVICVANTSLGTGIEKVPMGPLLLTASGVLAFWLLFEAITAMREDA